MVTRSTATAKTETKSTARKTPGKKPASSRKLARKAAAPVEPRAKKTGAPSTKARAPRAEKATSVARSLAKYRSMRDFERTAEPAGNAREPASGDSFVIQKHDASHLHYDFRLELDGVLLSWSVPKGPSLRAGERRLAVRTEDHPLDYASFEGIIPKGEYGGGTVIVWDRGRWTPEHDPHAMLKKGHLSFVLEGQKLSGRFHLVRTRRPEDKREHWLLFKGNDASASATADIVSERPESVISGRSIDDVRAAPGDVWHSNRAPKEGAGKSAAKKAAAPAKKRGTSPAVKAAPSLGAPDVDTASGRHDVVQIVKRLGLPFGLTNLDKVLYPENGL
ncbi:MAG: ligase, partial [Myxococcaceae bacterium]|nr:ligase [Myxococcaceae bacterium]